MEIILIVVGVLILIGIGLLFWKLNSSQGGDDLQDEIIRLKTESAQKEKELAELFSLRESTIAQKSTIDEKKNRIIQLEAQEEQLRERLKNAGNLVNKYEEARDRKDKEFEALVGKLNSAEEKLKEEQDRVRKKEEQRSEKERAERDRVWNDHENIVVSKLKDVCQKQDISFQFYDNTSLPPDFDGKLKPDFLVDFLDQYIIFDAKKSKDPRTYIRTQVKETAKKISGYSNIYKVVFFVMPLEEIQELKEVYYFEDGVSFHVVSLDSVEPILRNFKKISEYEKIQDFDPQDRENIVNLIASYDQHISLQNAVNIVLTRNSMKLIKHDNNLSSDFAEEVGVKKKTMGVGKVPQADVKQLAQALEKQEKETENLTTEKPLIDSENIDDAKTLLTF